LTRRRFLGGAVMLAAAPALASCRRETATPLADADAQRDGTVGLPGDVTQATEKTVGNWTVPSGTWLTAERYAMLLAVFDALIPGDFASPGATETRAAWYLDQLLGAFLVEPPRIYAGGPFSGRHGGLDGFSQWQPLTRVENLRWRTYLEGSQGLPEREWNGPVPGLQAQYNAGLDAIDAAAKAAFTKGLAELDVESVAGLLDSADQAFVSQLYTHVVEGMYGDPVYGGNHQQKGWKLIDYEGDRQPIGYTARQMSHPEEG
jgi:hypothetical protein